MANIFLKDPFKHQIDAVSACHNTDMDKFAYLMEMGTGKTLTALVDLVLLNQRDMVDYAVVLAPKSVYRNTVLVHEIQRYENPEPCKTKGKTAVAI